jgi:formate dehydrogenase maturation protein FdhE
VKCINCGNEDKSSFDYRELNNDSWVIIQTCTKCGYTSWFNKDYINDELKERIKNIKVKGKER